MPQFRISEAAELLGVSDDTVRRWVEAGRLKTTKTTGPQHIAGAELAAFARESAGSPTGPTGSSARNRFDGLVTQVTVDGVMAQVELQCGRQRVVSLISAESVRDLALEPGVRATASIKSTNVVIEVAP